MDQRFDPERLRPPEYVCEPDPRSTMLVRIDRSNGTVGEVELRDHHDEVAGFVLHAGVPEEIVVQFETSKNVYLYAWFVYRFYPVAEQHCLACLELALRERFKEEIRTRKVNFPGKYPTLYPLLKYAVDQGIVKNEGFEKWRNRRIINSRARVEMEKFREMTEKGLTEIAWSEADIEIKPEDLEWDYTAMLVKVLPDLRNDYAHGSKDLHNQSLRTVQIVSEIINQLYLEPA